MCKDMGVHVCCLQCTCPSQSAAIKHHALHTEIRRNKHNHTRDYTQHHEAARAAVGAREAAIEQQQRLGRTSPSAVPRVGMATMQNFQV